MAKVIAILGSLREKSFNSALKNKIINVDALLISTPEYNHGTTGVLKNTIDWLSRPPKDIPYVFGRKKVELIGAGLGRFGTALAQNAFLPILSYLNTNVYCGKRLFISSLNSTSNDAGKLVDSEIIKLLKDYLAGFCEFIENKN